MEPSIERAPISLTQTERETLISILRSAKHCEDSDCPLADEQLSLSQTVQDRLEGSKSVGATAGTNFGRDKHEAALGSTVMSVQLSIAEIDLLLRRLAGSEVSIKDSISGKLELLRDALLPTTAGSLADVAASVGLGSDPAPSVVPVTVLTGCLGAGKTTVIRGLLRGLPPGYKCAWLKNEYGDAGVDKTVAQDARVAVKEIVNGCLCCTKVGELADALRALHSLGPHRILVEASGSALPGPLVWEIEKETDIVRVDGVVTVVDCANFARINNFSRTAKIQAKCTDLVLLNKVELASEVMIEQVLDDINELVPEVPKVRTRGAKAATDPGVLFGLDAALWRSSGSIGSGATGETVRSPTEEESHMAADAECFHVLPATVPPGWMATRQCLEALMRFSADELYRSKGIVPMTFTEAEAEAARQGLPPPTKGQASNLGDTWWLFNGVAGRLTLEPLPNCAGPTSLVFMGQGLAYLVADLEKALKLPAGAVTDAGTLNQPKPKINIELGQRMVTCGVARGLSVPKTAANVD